MAQINAYVNILPVMPIERRQEQFTTTASPIDDRKFQPDALGAVLERLIIGARFPTAACH
jgi:hypothetical protein